VMSTLASNFIPSALVSTTLISARSAIEGAAAGVEAEAMTDAEAMTVAVAEMADKSLGVSVSDSRASTICFALWNSFRESIVNFVALDSSSSSYVSSLYIMLRAWISWTVLSKVSNASGCVIVSEDISVASVCMVGGGVR